MLQDLVSVGDKVPSLLSITGNRGTGYWQLQSKFQLNGGIDNGVKAKDFLLSIRVLRVSAHPYSGIHIRRELRAAEKEGVGFSAVIQDDAGDHSPFDDEIEACCLKFFLKIEDLVEDIGLIGIGLLKTEG